MADISSGPRHDAGRPLAVRADLAVSLGLLGLWCLVTIWRQWGHWPDDLSAIYVAGWLWQNGQGALIYDAPPGFFGGPAESWLPILAGLAPPGATSFPFVYPPLWAVLTAPLTGLMTGQDFANAVTLVHVPMLAGSVLLAARLFRPASMPLLLWVLIAITALLLSFQSYSAITLNQPTIAMMFLILLSFERLKAGAPVAAGIALALAAALKLTPAAFAVIFLIDRQQRAFLAFALTGAALAGLSVALAGWPLHAAFLDALGAVSGSALLSSLNISLLPAIMAGASALGLAAPFDPVRNNVIFHDVPGWIGPTLAVTAIAAFALLVARLRARRHPETRVLLVMALSILVPLFGPLGWQHYYLLPIFLLPGLIFRLPRRAVLLVAVLLASLSFKYAMVPFTLLPWPVPAYLWLFSASWLGILAAIFAVARRPAA